MQPNSPIDQLFELAKVSEVQVSFETIEKDFLQKVSSISQKSNPNKLYKMIALNTLIVGLLCFTGYQLLQTNNPIQSKKPTSQQVSSVTSLRENKHQNDIPIQNTLNHSSMKISKESFELDVIKSPESTILSNIIFEKPDIIESKIENDPTSEETEIRLPKLTPEEISFSQKVKKQLLKSIHKTDKKDWAYIPSGSFTFQNETFSAQAFYMLKYEVTNEQYLAFIYDLVIQENKQAYAQAIPNQEQWNTYFKKRFDSYTNNYFSSTHYQQYPVVNISRAGAELFCIWLNEEYLKAYPKNSNKLNPIRLPLRVEWAKAASASGQNTTYPWEGNKFTNENGQAMANFVRNDLPTVTDSIAKKYSFEPIAPSKSFWPNYYGIYNLGGNVAEMVYENPKKEKPGTAGGSFEKTAEYMELNASDPYNGITTAVPVIGFRIVFTSVSP